MTRSEEDGLVRLDLSNPQFQEELLAMQKPDRHSALETLSKLRRMNWSQVYRDNGLKWEKIVSIVPPTGITAVYSLRLTQSRRATAFRDGDFIRFLSIAPDHDATYDGRSPNVPPLTNEA